MDAVDRRRFLTRSHRREAGVDAPIPIGHGQTTSQPSLIRRMIQAMEITPTDRVLEIGTGSGYQTAILARLAAEVVSVETVPELAEQARARLADLDNVTVHIGDGSLGWPQGAPYDAITVGAAAPHVPQALLDQLAESGRLVIPVETSGGCWVELHRRRGDGWARPRKLVPVRFVPLIGSDAHPPGI